MSPSLFDPDAADEQLVVHVMIAFVAVVVFAWMAAMLFMS
jgi:hypothetical protein